MDVSTFSHQYRSLPEEARHALSEFLQYLTAKHQTTDNAPEEKRKFKFDWEGALKDVGEKHTSVELQHLANQWR